MTNIPKANAENAATKVYTLTNNKSIELKVIPYGGRIISLKVPDRHGKSENIVLGFQDPEKYLQENPFFGAIVGRYSNRIAGGKFSIDGKQYSLVQNNGTNHLHGGEYGFDKAFWSVEHHLEKNILKLSYCSPHLEEGYPGEVNVVVTYSLQESALEVAYEATTTEKTILNLTQHSYFNLSGNFKRQVIDHEIAINADKFLPVDANVIPTGRFQKVDGTPFDFRTSKPLGKKIDSQHEQLELVKGYDHTWVLDPLQSGEQFAASAFHPASGRVLEVFTTEPGLHLYTGNFLEESLPDPESGEKFQNRSGFCFETQHFPDSPNQPQFPTVILQPGEVFTSKTTFKFSVK